MAGQKNYGTKECACGVQFEAHSSRHKRCDTCRAVKQAASMRNISATCRGCTKRYYRRDGHDMFCPGCHVGGFGDKRWHPGDPLKQPCPICGESDLSVAPRLEFCASCLADPDLSTAIKVNAALRAYMLEVAESEPARDKVSPRPNWSALHHTLRDRIVELLLASPVAETVCERDGDHPVPAIAGQAYDRYAEAWNADGERRDFSEWLAAEFTGVPA